MYIAILGRQPQLSIAELERVFGNDTVEWFSSETATVDTADFSIDHIGGTLKAGRIVIDLPNGSWRHASKEIVDHYSESWNSSEGKLTLGISAYGFDVTSREVQKTGIILKQTLKKADVSLRLIPNHEPKLNTATSHHNKLGLSPNKVELLVVRGKSGRIVIAESAGAQNITALAKRDQARPKRDAFVGMLPPKLAQIMLNLAIASTEQKKEPCAVLDPFCGTGVILQEASLRGCSLFGSDLNPKMIEYTLANLKWLKEKFNAPGTIGTFAQADATAHRWIEAGKDIDAVVTETYLGQPFSAPPSPAKLREVRGNCNHIITKFLENIGSQVPSGLPLCVAVPAWRDTAGSFTHLPLVTQLDQLGYRRVEFKNISADELLYYREDQVVARELLVLTKT
jgi:tRNA G10  N-methylase Trm11